MVKKKKKRKFQNAIFLFFSKMESLDSPAFVDRRGSAQFPKNRPLKTPEASWSITGLHQGWQT